MIDSKYVIGEANTGFEKRGDKGLFQCGNCKYFHDGYCDHPIMMKESKQPKNKEGYVKVDALDCCDYVDRRTKTIGEVLKDAPK